MNRIEIEVVEIQGFEGIKHSSKGGVYVKFKAVEQAKKGQKFGQRHSVVMFDLQAEMFANAMRNGFRPFTLKGSLSYVFYQKQDGTKVYTTDIIGSDLVFNAPVVNNQYPNQVQQPQQQQQQQHGLYGTYNPQINSQFAGDDIPF